MTEAVFSCEGYTSEALEEALKPYVQGAVELEVRPRTVRVRSPVVDPNVLAGVIQAGATVLTTLISGLIAWRRDRDRAAGQAAASAHPIRIYGADGTVVEIPVDTDARTLSSLIEQVRQTPRPRIELL
jgi:hypothetical protein